MGFGSVLRARGEAGLVLLLRLRPDLAAPPPSSVRGLEARATSRASLDRALAGLDELALQVLEAVLALTRAVGHGPPTTADLARATGAPQDDVERAVRLAVDLALVWGEDDAGHAQAHDAGLGGLHLQPSPGLEEAIGPYPAGLGPSLTRTLERRDEAGIAALAATIEDVPSTVTADDDASPTEALARRIADPATVRRLLAASPPGTRQVLDALLWGPPVGRTPERGATTARGPARSAVEWLLRHGLLAVSDAHHVVLPREVALALRDGRTHREPAVAPRPAPHPVDPRTVAADSAQHAQEAVRLLRAVVAHWGAEPGALLRSGGLGVRELRRLSVRLGCDDAVAALLVEVAVGARLVSPDGEEPASVLPTTEADDWLGLDVTEQWAQAAAGWLVSDRAAWLVGTRDERGTVRAALDPELRRPWAPRLRRTVLEVLGEADGALGPAQVHDVLRWRSPRSAPAEHAVEAVLHEAAVLGLTGAGVLAPAGHALLSPDDDGGAAHALAGQLPPPVDEVLLQGDLTGIVPGRPSAELAELLDACAVVESRGAAVTVRFTEASVQRALDAGTTAEGVLAALSRHARTGVPQPLEYLVLDAARRHGRVRAGAASAYLRSDDPALLAGLVEDRALHHLGLLRLAPTVLAAQAPPAALLAALRDRGVAAVAEDASGRAVTLDATRRRVRPARRPTAPSAGDVDTSRERRLQRVVADLLAAHRREETERDPGPGQDATAAPPAGTPDPLAALALLREAVAEGREVWLELVDPAGAPVRRRVRPIRVDAGRVRAVDTVREAELTVAVHRITAVTPV